jgi:hypothetical protein
VKGQFELKGAKVEAVKDDKKEHAFEIKLGDQSMRLAAETAETAREWIEAINVGIAGTADKKGKVCSLHDIFNPVELANALMYNCVALLVLSVTSPS